MYGFIIENDRMRRAMWFLASTVMFALVIGSLPAQAQQSQANEPDPEAKAEAIFKRMTEFLAQAQQLSVTIESEFDVVQDSGEKYTFGESRAIAIRRPGHLRMDTAKRDGAKSGMVFNGKDITAFDLQDNVYATVAKPGSVDDAIAYFIDALDMRMPLAEFFSSASVKTLPERVLTADYIEQETIAGVTCDHLGLHGDRADLQVWVAQGDQPLPQRVIITYARAEGQPQFRAQFRDWNLSPNTPDSFFAFTPPDGVTKIVFAPRRRGEPEPAE